MNCKLCVNNYIYFAFCIIIISVQTFTNLLLLFEQQVSRTGFNIPVFAALDP